MKTDTELWEAAVGGDAAAWGTLVRRYQALVYAVATRSGLSYADAADCFQQTWVLLHQNRRTIQDPSRLSAWLVTTAKREALRIIRGSRRQSALDDIAEPVDTNEIADEELVRLERQAHLETAIDRLDKRCQRLMDLMFFADEKKSYEEIARIMGISSNALGPARRRCLDRLRKILEDSGFTDARKSD